MVVEGFDLICDDFRLVYNYKTWEPYLVNSSLYQSILVRPPVSQGLGKTGSHSSKMIPSIAENSRMTEKENNQSVAMAQILHFNLMELLW